MRYAKDNSSGRFAAVLIVFLGGTMTSTAIDAQVTDPARPAVALAEGPDPFGGGGNDREGRNLCGGIDNRVTSGDLRVGRLVFYSGVATGSGCTGSFGPFCTAWLVSNGSLVTAGHCVDLNANGVIDTTFRSACVEFNVSSLLTPGHTSTCGGTPAPAPANDVYVVDWAAMSAGDFNFDGQDWTGSAIVGSDYAVFSVLPNANTQLSPAVAQRAFFRVTQEVPDNTDDVRVTGCGIDTHPNGCGGGPCTPDNCNVDSRTIQTEVGGYRGEADRDDGRVWHQYRVDTQGANSGSPVIWEGNNDFAIGAHTRGACAIAGISSNQGTSFNHNHFANALNGFLGPYTTHVDSMSMASKPDGTIFAPYLNVQDGVDDTGVGTRLSIVTGSYSGPVTIDKEMMILTPVGPVTIGN